MLRSEIGCRTNDTMLLSVGELNQNKNHETIIRILAKMGRKDFHYAIVGSGQLHEYLENLIKELGIAKNVHLLGYRHDISGWYAAADIFVFPSLREGLSVSLMEAMASGLPCVVGRIRGNTDLIREGKGGWYAGSEQEYMEKINLLAAGPEKRKQMGAYNQKAVREYGDEAVMETMRAIYRSTGF